MDHTVTTSPRTTAINLIRAINAICLTFQTIKGADKNKEAWNQISGNVTAEISLKYLQ